MSFFFFFKDTAPTEIYTLSLHDALPIWPPATSSSAPSGPATSAASSDLGPPAKCRSEEHTSELQSRFDLVCRLLLEKKKNNMPTTSLQSYDVSDAVIPATHLTRTPHPPL